MPRETESLKNVSRIPQEEKKGQKSLKYPVRIVTFNNEEFLDKMRSGFFTNMQFCSYNPADNSVQSVRP
jgi:hypothetical protein